jgi:hypothetical protein
MKTKLTLFLSILILFLSLPALATHLVGGEIAWECHPTTGKYRFHAKLYRECGVGTPNPAGMPALISLVRGPTTIICSQVQVRSIVNPCYDPVQSIQCGVTPVGEGAVEVGVFRSTWTTLNGVPPASGWTFSWASCCRPASVINVISTSFQLRATMYPYNGINASTCYDNSPVFLERPTMSYCNGTLALHNNMAIDYEAYDSLYYRFVSVKQQNGQNVVYASGYSFDNPVPDQNLNPLNSGIALDSINGEFAFTSHTNGAFALGIGVESWRFGQLISLVVKDYPVIVRNCVTSPGICVPGINSAPRLLLKADTINFPKTPLVTKIYGSKGSLDGFETCAKIGDTLRIRVSSLDTNIKPNCLADNVTLKTKGLTFTTDTNYADPLQCAFLSPCATLTSLNSGGGFTHPTTNDAMFEWAINPIHLNYFGIGNNKSVNYTFYFKVYDDKCPIPATNYMTYTVKVKAPVPSPPLINSCLNIVSSSGDVNFNISPSLDSADAFKGYIVYHSINKNGPFLPIDTIKNYNVQGFSDKGRGTGRHFYFLRTASLFLSETSDTLTTINLQVAHNQTTNPAQADLSWGAYVSNPGANVYYQIYKKDSPTAIWNLIDSTQFTQYSDLISGNFNDLEYKVGINGECFSIDGNFIGLDEDNFIENIKIYPIPFTDELSIEGFEGYSDISAVSLTDLSGRVISAEFTSENEKLVISNLGSLSKGVYILRIFENEKIYSFKVLR